MKIKEFLLKIEQYKSELQNKAEVMKYLKKFMFFKLIFN